MRTTAGDEPAFSCKPSGALKKKSRQRSDAAGGETRRAGQGELERATGIEPAWKAWKASALPLSYTRMMFVAAGAVRLRLGSHSYSPQGIAQRSALSRVAAPYPTSGPFRCTSHGSPHEDLPSLNQFPRYSELARLGFSYLIWTAGCCAISCGDSLRESGDCSGYFMAHLLFRPAAACSRAHPASSYFRQR